jgi:hypothetical protein
MDVNKAHQMADSWVRVFKNECEEQFGETDGGVIFISTIGATLGQLFQLHDSGLVFEVINTGLKSANVSYRLTQLT